MSVDLLDTQYNSYYSSDIITLCLLRNVLSKYVRQEYKKKNFNLFNNVRSTLFSENSYHIARDIDIMI